MIFPLHLLLSEFGVVLVFILESASLKKRLPSVPIYKYSTNL